MKKENRGITLIALVITVIILVILAAVAVSAITGNDGLFSKANNVGTLYNEKARAEADELNGLLSYLGIGDKQDNPSVTDPDEEEPYSYVTTGLKAYYDAKNNTGNGYSATTTIWKDLSGNNNDGIINGATWNNEALTFDGVDDFVNLGYHDYGNVTLEVVFELNKLNEKQCILGNWQNGGYGINLAANNTLQSVAYMNSTYASTLTNVNEKNIIVSTVLTVNKEKFKFYINGEIKQNLDCTGLIEMPDTNTIMAIGANPAKNSAVNEFLEGKIYSVRIYNKALTEEEVKKNYNYDNERYGINETFFNGVQLADNKYTIANKADLEKFRDEVNLGKDFSNIYVELTNDVDLSSVTSWNPIGTEDIAFTGIFDGNGHNISNLNIDNGTSVQGLFANNAGVIECLNISSGNVKGTFKIGAIAGTNSGIILNCNNSAAVTTTAYHSAGICGYNTGNVEKCTNNAVITSTEGTSIAGIVGRSDAGIIKFCANLNSVSSESRTVGGVVGCNSASIISSCYNTGNVEGELYIGGIAGYNTSSATIKASYNMGISVNGYAVVGGICGTNVTDSKIISCYNKASLSASGRADGAAVSDIGGISGANSYNSTVENCYNTGNATAVYMYIGGIVGYNGNADAGTQIVKNVFNTGTLSMNGTKATANIGTTPAYVGYLIGRYGSLSGKYGNTTKTAIAGWDQATITANIGSLFVKNNNASVNDGLPLLNWQ